MDVGKISGVTVGFRFFPRKFLCISIESLVTCAVLMTSLLVYCCQTEQEVCEDDAE